MTVTNYPGDPKDRTDDTPFDALKHNSLKAAGVAYLLGDAALFASGAMAGRYKEASSGLLWGIGGLVCAKYANPSAEKQLKLLSSRLSHYLRRQGIEIPHTPDTETLAQKDGIIDHVEAFLYQYPSQVLNATYAVGAAQLIRSGLQHGKHWDAASGALVAAGALSGLLVQEKKPDPDHPPKTAFSKAMTWLQEKPLRISGGLYALNNVALIMSALKERRTNPAMKSYWFKFLTAASYIFGNTMLALSSKENGGSEKDTKEAMDKLATAAAHVIAAQAPEVQEGLVSHIAGYLASQPSVGMKADEINTLLHDKLRQTRSLPHATGWQYRVTVPGTEQFLPTL